MAAIGHSQKNASQKPVTVRLLCIDNFEDHLLHAAIRNSLLSQNTYYAREMGCSRQLFLKHPVLKYSFSDITQYSINVYLYTPEVGI